jgi:hypothetical protein
MYRLFICFISIGSCVDEYHSAAVNDSFTGAVYIQQTLTIEDDRDQFYWFVICLHHLFPHERITHLVARCCFLLSAFMVRTYRWSLPRHIERLVQYDRFLTSRYSVTKEICPLVNGDVSRSNTCSHMGETPIFLPDNKLLLLCGSPLERWR